MADFSTARRMMVDGQVRTSDVTDLRIISAFSSVPRERFVAPSKTALAYLDLDVPVADGAADRAPDAQADGAGQAHPGARNRGERSRSRLSAAPPDIRRPSSQVSPVRWSRLKRMRNLPVEAAKTLSALGYANVEVVRGPLTAGWPAGAPYDAILIDGAVEVMPDSIHAPAQGRRPPCLRSRPQTAGKSLSVPPDRGRTQRKADFRRHGSVIAGICREAGLRFLTKLRKFSWGVAGKTQPLFFFRMAKGGGCSRSNPAAIGYKVRCGLAIPAGCAHDGGLGAA